MADENNTQANAQGPQFMLQRIYLKDASFESPRSPLVFQSQWQPKINFDIKTKSEKVQDGVYEVVLVLTVEADREWTMNDHLTIVAALRNRDLIAAERAIRQHISRDFYRLIAARLDVLYPIGPTNE